MPRVADHVSVQARMDRDDNYLGRYAGSSCLVKEPWQKKADKTRKIAKGKTWPVKPNIIGVSNCFQTVDESVPHQYQYLNQYKLKLICGCLEITRDNLTSTSVKVVPLIVTSIVSKVLPRNIAVWLRYRQKLQSHFSSSFWQFPAISWQFSSFSLVQLQYFLVILF